MRFINLLILACLLSCDSQSDKKVTVEAPPSDSKDSTGSVQPTVIKETVAKDIDTPSVIEELHNSIHDTDFVDLADYSSDFTYEFRYADTNNFLHEKVYDCAKCLLRKEVVDALILANDSLKLLGYRIRLFDCYRPLSIQRKMWAIFPDGRYVANPYKSGSIHNRGGAVDLTIETREGKKLDMGTDFDHFGIEAHIDYKDLSDSIKSNRKKLEIAMRAAGFSPLKTEWWHFNFGKSKKYSVSNFPINCE